MKNDGMVQNMKNWLTQKQTMTFPWNKKKYHKDYIFKSRHFLAVVTFNFEC